MTIDCSATRQLGGESKLNNKLNWHSYLLDLDGISSRERVLVVDHSPVLPSEMRGLLRAMLTRPAKGLLSAHGCNV